MQSFLFLSLPYSESVSLLRQLKWIMQGQIMKNSIMNKCGVPLPKQHTYIYKCIQTHIYIHIWSGCVFGRGWLKFNSEWVIKAELIIKCQQLSFIHMRWFWAKNHKIYLFLIANKFSHLWDMQQTQSMSRLYFNCMWHYIQRHLALTTMNFCRTL